MKRTTTLGLGATVAAATALGLLSGPALAQAPTDEPALVPDGCVPAARIEQARTRILRGIDNRLERVDQLQARTAATEALTDAHENRIDTVLDHDEGALTALRAVVVQEGDGCSLADEGRAVVEEFRIYVVVTPQTRLAIGGDRIAAAEHRLTEIGRHLDEAIDAAEADGQDVTEARQLLAVYEQEAGAAVAQAGPIADVVLPLNPGDWPDPARTALDHERGEVRSAVQHLKNARDAAERIRADLQP